MTSCENCQLSSRMLEKGLVDGAGPLLHPPTPLHSPLAPTITFPKQITFNYFLTKRCRSIIFFLDCSMQGPLLIVNSLLKEDRKTDCWSHFLQVCPNLERHNTCNEDSNLTAPNMPEEINSPAYFYRSKT